MSSDLEQAEIGGRADHPQLVEEMMIGMALRKDEEGHVACNVRLVVPALAFDNPVADIEAGSPAFDHHAHRPAGATTPNSFVRHEARRTGRTGRRIAYEKAI